MDAYCVVVVVTSCYRTALSLVAADAMLSTSPLKDSMNSSAGIAPGRGTWAPPLVVAVRMASPLCVISWMCAAAFAKTKESAEGLEFQMTLSSVSFASWNWDFHFYHVRSIRGNPSNLGCLSGKLFSARRERDATATSHTYEISRPDRVAFLCASLQQVMNSGTRGSSTHQDNILCWRPITSIASPTVLVAPRWSRISRRVTCL